LASLLWGDVPAACAKAYLRKTLWQLQAALDTYTKSLSKQLLDVTPDWVRLNSRPMLWLDAAILEQAFHLVKSVPGMALSLQQLETLHNSVQLYRGDLLEGWYQDWCLLDRHRFQYMYLTILDKLMDYYETQKDCEASIAYGNLSLHCDRAREQTHRRLMRLLYRTGDRTAALRQYQHCILALREELEVEPSTSTVELYEQIRTDRLDKMAPDRPGTQLVPTQLPPEALDHLRQLQADLVHIMRQVEHDVQQIELIVKGQY
jgi:DNA-binding SARP family transcriptional activator